MKANIHTEFFIFRALVCLFLFIHGINRLAAWQTDIPGLAAFLNEKGLVFGTVLAWAITLLETAGAVLIATGTSVKWIAPLFIFYLVMGIVMVHRHHGWFVVGPSQDGMEYNALLVVCMSFLWVMELKLQSRYGAVEV